MDAKIELVSVVVFKQIITILCLSILINICLELNSRKVNLLRWITIFLQKLTQHSFLE